MSALTPEQIGSVMIRGSLNGTLNYDILPLSQPFATLQKLFPGMDMGIATPNEKDAVQAFREFELTHYPVMPAVLHRLGEVSLNSPAGMMEAIELSGTYLAPFNTVYMLWTSAQAEVEEKTPIVCTNQPMLIPTHPIYNAFNENVNGGIIITDFNTILDDSRLNIGTKLKQSAVGAVFKGMKWWYEVDEHLKNIAEDSFFLGLDYLADWRNKATRSALENFGVMNHRGLKITEKFDLAHLDRLAATMQNEPSQRALARIRANSQNWVRSIRNSKMAIPEAAMSIYPTNAPGKGMKDLGGGAFITERLSYTPEMPLRDEEVEFLNQAETEDKDVIVISFSSQPHLPQEIDERDLTLLLEEAAKSLEGTNTVLFYANTMEYELRKVAPELESKLFITQGRLPLDKVFSHAAVKATIGHSGQGSNATANSAGLLVLPIPATAEQRDNMEQIINRVTTDKEYDMSEMLKSPERFIDVLNEALADIVPQLDRETTTAVYGSKGQFVQAFVELVSRTLSNKK